MRPGALVRFSSLAEESLEGEEEIRVLTRTDQDRPPLASPPLERRGSKVRDRRLPEVLA